MNDKKMKEIKMRAYGYESKKMFYWNINDCQSGWVSPDQKISEKMLFIGLADKNRIKVYEGDIVEYTRKYLTRSFMAIGVVKHGNFASDDIAGEYNIRHEYVGFYIEGDYQDWREGNFEYHKYRIIGNIYENPELLDKV